MALSEFNVMKWDYTTYEKPRLCENSIRNTGGYEIVCNQFLSFNF